MFLPFLPEDNSVLDTNTDEALQILNEDIGGLLRCEADNFWRTVLDDKSLHSCLTSYLQFARRGYDSIPNSDATFTRVHLQLAKRVFLTFLRMVTIAEKGGPVQTEQAKQLYDRWLLDVPKLLDIAALYGPDNPELTRQLLTKVFTLQPRYGNDVADLVPTLVSNFMDVRTALQDAAQRLRTSRDAGSLQSLIDGLSYWEDVTQTLSAFVEAFPPAAGLLLQADGALLVQLTPLYSALIPELQRGLAAASEQTPAAAQMWRQLVRLKEGVQKLAYHLLHRAYLDSGAQALVPPSQSWASAVPQAAAARGAALMTALTEADELEGDAEASLLKGMNARYHLDRAVTDALQQRYIALDNVQQDYLMVLLGSKLSSAATSRVTSNGHAGPSSAQQTAQLNEKIEKIRELFPDYGAGFLAACLSAYDDMASSMPELSWRSLAITDDTPQPSGSSAAQRPPPAPSAASKPVHRGVSRFLDRTGNDDRAAIKLHAKAAEYEYDDEYDDSYDDLGGGGADGVADVEGDDEDAALLVAGMAPARQGPPSRGPSPGRSGVASSSSGPGPASQAQQQRQQRAPRTWMLDGRLYNYPKPGAVEFKGKESAAQAQDAARAAAYEIHGLGRGGNVPPPAPVDTANGNAEGEASEASNRQGQQPPSGQPGRGRGRGSNAFKDKHKAAIANHHRKDRALRKMGPPV
ncbi:hypothetical protein WJX75_006462 [Coccomyxa subellipsoidea]|uniref:CUE domain-containing protein n=1 Tax=Coccomyxa subellipsoidea TaxID=248742 RepID=A0ABR2YPU7_9CHLO